MDVSYGGGESFKIINGLELNIGYSFGEGFKWSVNPIHDFWNPVAEGRARSGRGTRAAATRAARKAAQG